MYFGELNIVLEIYSKTVSSGSISNQTTALGLGTTENMNGRGCDKVAQLWFWPLLTTVLLITLPQIHSFLSVPDWILLNCHL